MKARLPKITKTVIATRSKYLILKALESNFEFLRISNKTISIPRFEEYLLLIRGEISTKL
jgi:hypothetical protein